MTDYSEQVIAGRTNLMGWPDEYCPCVVPMRQMVDVAGLKHLDCGKRIAEWGLEARKYDPDAGPRRQSGDVQ